MNDRNLEDLQKTFGGWVTADKSPLKAAPKVQGAIRSVVVEQGELTAEARVAIYWRMFRARTTGALAEDFSLCEAIVGEDEFFELALRYVQAHPSQSYTLAHLGKAFAGFLAESVDIENHGRLADVARFEWGLVEAFHAERSPDNLSDATLSIEQEALLSQKFVLAPSAQVLHLAHLVTPLWKRHLKGEALEGLMPEAKPEAVAVYRRGNKSAYLVIEAVERDFLVALCEGDTLEAAIDRISADLKTEEDCARVLQATGTWLREGLILLRQHR